MSYYSLHYSLHADGKGGYCKPDICSISHSDGSIAIIEVKTGGAGLSTQQKAGFEQVGVDSKGQPMYRIPPDATVAGDLLIALDLKPGEKIGAAYPDGIPVKIERVAGLNEAGE